MARSVARATPRIGVLPTLLANRNGMNKLRGGSKGASTRSQRGPARSFSSREGRTRRAPYSLIACWRRRCLLAIATSEDLLKHGGYTLMALPTPRYLLQTHQLLCARCPSGRDAAQCLSSEDVLTALERKQVDVSREESLARGSFVLSSVYQPVSRRSYEFIGWKRCRLQLSSNPVPAGLSFVAPWYPSSGLHSNSGIHEFDEYEQRNTPGNQICAEINFIPQPCGYFRAVRQRTATRCGSS